MFNNFQVIAYSGESSKKEREVTARNCTSQRLMYNQCQIENFGGIMNRGIFLFFALLIAFAMVTGCDKRDKPAQQKPTAKKDSRTHLLCYINKFGSGVVMYKDETSVFVLTSSFCTKDSDSVEVTFLNEFTLKQSTTQGTVVARSATGRGDFALVRTDNDMIPSKPTWTPIAEDIPANTSQFFKLLLSNFDTSIPPTIIDAPISTGSYTPSQPKTMYGTLGPAVRNPVAGNPVFDGDKLVGIVLSEGFMEMIGISTNQGHIISLPNQLRDFLLESGQSYIGQ